MADILVVDDDTVYRLVFAHLLSGVGHDVTAADCLTSALDACRERSFDLVVADYQMPDGTGLDLFEALSAQPPRPGFVLVTSTHEQDDLGDDRVFGIDAYFTKPVASPALTACIDDLLSAGLTP